MKIHASRLGQMALCLVALAASVAPLQATDITFDFSSQTSPVSSFTLTSAGYSLTLSNPNPGSFQYLSASYGLWMGQGAAPLAFDIQVAGGPLVFKNYEVGSAFAGGVLPFDLTGGTGTSTGNSLATAGVINYNGSYSITTSQTVRLTAGYNNVGASYLKSMTFSTVPEPSTYALAAIATGVIGMVTRSRRASKKA